MIIRLKKNTEMIYLTDITVKLPPPWMVMLPNTARILTGPWPFSICIFSINNGSMDGTLISGIPASIHATLVISRSKLVVRYHKNIYLWEYKALNDLLSVQYICRARDPI